MKWIVVHEGNGTGDIDVTGLHVSLSASVPAAPSGRDLAVASLQRSNNAPAGWPSTMVLVRQLARYVPSDAGGAPLDFGELAAKARGDALLGILKMDGDSLGVKLNSLLRDAVDLDELARFGRRLDEFMACTLDAEVQKPEWATIYTIFAGGDDVLLVGPWNILFAYAGHVRNLFMKEFAGEGLTISAGLSFFRPRRPIRRAAAQAERLLEQAKTEMAPKAHESKDQIAAFGQIWKWKDHEAVLNAGRNLADWVDHGNAQRGWLFTLLELAELRHKHDVAVEDRLRATARLDYHVTRNYPTTNDRNRESANLRRWADHVVRDFDEATGVDTIFLPTIVRYALTATRPREEEG